jgi:hypothetical protein
MCLQIPSLTYSFSRTLRPLTRSEQDSKSNLGSIYHEDNRELSSNNSVYHMLVTSKLRYTRTVLLETEPVEDSF